MTPVPAAKERFTEPGLRAKGFVGFVAASDPRDFTDGSPRRARGSRVLAFDPPLDDDEIVQVGAVPWHNRAESLRDVRTSVRSRRHACRGPCALPRTP